MSPYKIYCVKSFYINLESPEFGKKKYLRGNFGELSDK